MWAPPRLSCGSWCVWDVSPVPRPVMHETLTGQKAFCTAWTRAQATDHAPAGTSETDQRGLVHEESIGCRTPHQGAREQHILTCTCAWCHGWQYARLNALGASGCGGRAAHCAGCAILCAASHPEEPGAHSLPVGHQVLPQLRARPAAVTRRFVLSTAYTHHTTACTQPVMCRER